MKRHNIISVSVMCSDLLNLERDIRRLERAGVDWLHVDMMDAHLVPNLTFGPDFVNAMHRVTSMPLDIHLMVEDPELMLSKIELRAGDTFSVHVELGRNFGALSSEVRSRGASFGLVLNPETDASALAPHVGLFDMVTVMLVRPGFAGAKLIDGITGKVADVRRWLDDNGCRDVRISADGSVNCERASAMAAMGASVFVGGTAGIYRRDMELEEAVRALRAAIS